MSTLIRPFALRPRAAPSSLRTTVGSFIVGDCSGPFIAPTGWHGWNGGQTPRHPETARGCS